MTSTPPTQRRSLRRQGLSARTKLIASASLAALGVIAAGAMATALWNAEYDVSGARVTAGDLNVSYGSGTWKQVTPGVTTPAGGTLAAGTDGFHSMPGDVIEMIVPITTTLRGENLNAVLSVETGNGATQDLIDGVVSATYRVEDATGTPVAPATGEAELGTPVEVPGLVSSNAGETANWTVVVTVTVLGDYRWTQLEPIVDLDSWAIDGVNVTLDQVRSGTGFASASAAS
ncbi:hypothetical protein [Leucobacter chromiireducens]|uniref:hypothetical protein n=1 Tax=Leucobacter chromiireducens TaxID=283877 RepID=UPI000F631455|nr:hypothetical protein [Leucobacter chromiireducens]